jgi:hypothetical protein
MRSEKLASLFIAFSVGCSVAPDEDPASSADALSGGTVIGQWDHTNAYAFGGRDQAVYATSLTSAGYAPGGVRTDTDGFQCVELAVRYFHFRKNVSAGSWHVGKAIDMCATHPSGVSRTNDPQPGDLVVLHANEAAIATGPAGHVAIVKGTSGDAVMTFNQRWANDSTAFATVSRRRDVACFLHADGGSPPPSSGQQCTPQEIASATLNGRHFWTCEGSTRYICDDQGNKIVQSCAGGCRGAGVGADDQCASAGVSCTAAERANATLNGAHFWTCEAVTRFICDDRGNKVAQGCASRCQSEGAGHDDQCS